MNNWNIPEQSNEMLYWFGWLYKAPSQVTYVDRITMLAEFTIVICVAVACAYVTEKWRRK